MTIDATAVGIVGDPVRRRWDSKDALLYALGVGARSDELAYVTENTEGVEQRVLPTFGVLLCSAPEMLDRVGSFDPACLVHGSQSVEVHTPIPTEGEVDVVGRVDEIHDKGSAAVVVISATATDVVTGEVLISTTTSAFLRGEGGFGGERGSTTRVEMPTRPPDWQFDDETRVEQALIYRLSGDRNPLHSDPAFAARGGFDRPILHGLCTFGFAGRAVVSAAAAGDVTRVRSIAARFSAPVLPGDRLRTDMWDDGHGIAFRTMRGADVVLDGGRVHLHD